MDDQVTAENLSVMVVMDSTGDTTITWDPTNEDSVADARNKFNELRGRGYQAFRMSAVPDDEEDNDSAVVEEKGERIDRFDPKAGKVMMVPQHRGG